MGKEYQEFIETIKGSKKPMEHPSMIAEASELMEANIDEMDVEALKSLINKLRELLVDGLGQVVLKKSDVPNAYVVK